MNKIESSPISSFLADRLLEFIFILARDSGWLRNDKISEIYPVGVTLSRLWCGLAVCIVQVKRKL